MAGMGKTTLARVAFNRFSTQFRRSFFIGNIREDSERHGRDYLERTFFSNDMFKLNNFTKYRIQHQKVLVVLDDADDLEQLKRLVGDRTWFESGTRIIITTRNRELLRLFAINAIYKVDGLNFDEALQLLSRNAFRGRPNLSLGHAQLSQLLVPYTHGIPLVLKELGSFLRGRSTKEWERAMEKLKRTPLNDIHQVLRVSYDELDEMEKDVFLDIACFLKGRDRDFVERKLQEFGNQDASAGIAVLMDKSLISIKEDDEIYMHDLVRGTAWEIVRCSPKKRERNYWSSIKQGIEVEGRFFEKSNIDYEELPLRLGNSYNHNYHDYPPKSLPSDINPPKLVELDLPRRELKQYWNEEQDTSPSPTIGLIISYDGQWRKTWGRWSFDGQKTKGMTISEDITYHELVERLSRSLMVDQSQYDLDMRFLVDSVVPLPPVEIQIDEDVKFFIGETSSKDSLRYPLCITLIKVTGKQHV